MQVELIKAVKQKENMTNRQIAEKTGLSESTVSRILSRQVEPKFEDVVLIAVAVGVSLDALAGIARDESEEVKELRALLAEKDAQLATYERIVSSYDKLLAEKDGGHGMIFTDRDGTMYLSLHSPNVPCAESNEKTVFVPVREENGTLVCDM